MDAVVEGITWFKRSSVRIRRDDVEIHVDPHRVEDSSPADYVLLTHPHYDNFREEDIERVRDPKTVLIAPASMKVQLRDADHFMRPGDLLQLDRFDVLAVPAHNLGKRYHPASSEWLGYVFTVGGVTYYHAGDTDFLDSMSQIRCDVALLPCEGEYTMGPGDAARAGEACGASVVIPIHWGAGPNASANAQKVVELLPGRGTLLESGVESHA